MNTHVLFVCAGLAAVGLFAQPRTAEASGTEPIEPEDSPLFAQSMQRAFERFAVWDQNSSPARSAVLASEIIVVEGERWYRLASKSVPGADPVSGTPKPYAPTLDPVVTCMIGTSCVVACPPTSHGGGTCAPHASCSPGPTCAVPTCGPIPTCSVPTCADWPTCAGILTCSTTCMGTCSPATCPAPSLSGVVVSNNPAGPGAQVVAFSFNASGTVKYSVQCSTNVSGSEWTEILSKLGDNSTTVVLHSNSAPRAFYRVVMQNP